MSSTRALGLRIHKVMIPATACLLLGAVGLFAQGEQAFKGQVIQCKCSPGSSDANAPCAAACTKKGSTYVLYDAKNKASYQLDKQKKSKNFAGQYVFVIGSLDQATNTIQVDDMVRTLPPKVMQAKSVYIYCDGCVRGMAKAKPAAFEQLTAWNHFTVVPDPHKADLIFLFSANPYLGDYVTRDGPDKRPVEISTTYMNVVDPQTGENLWGDSREWGSLLVGKATRDLIREFADQLNQQNTLDAQQ